MGWNALMSRPASPSPSILMAAVVKAGPMGRRVGVARRSLRRGGSEDFRTGLGPWADRYLAVIVAVALVAAVVSFPGLSDPSLSRALIALSLAGAMLLASLYPLPLVSGTKLYLDTAVLVAAVIVFSPGLALLVVACGRLAGSLARREPRDQAFFNVGVIILQAVGGGAILAWLGGPWLSGADTPRPGQIGAALVAGGVMWVLNTLLIAPMLALHRNEPLTRSWRRTAFGGGGAETAMELAQVGVGVAIAALVVSPYLWAAPRPSQRLIPV